MSWLSERAAGDEDAVEISESIEVFLDLHYLESEKREIISKAMHAKLQPFRATDKYDALTQAVVWAKKQLALDSANEKGTDLLDFRQITTEWRSVLEKMIIGSSFPTYKPQLTMFYGDRLFKCPRVWCQYFHLGFERLDQARKHQERHERAYTCTFMGCPRTTFGYAVKKDLDNHLRTDHGILNDASEFPQIRKRAAESDDEHEPRGRYKCTYCPKTFTQTFNLKSHLVTHTGERAFVCGTCEKAFGRAHDLKRHEKIHAREKQPVLDNSTAETINTDGYSGYADDIGFNQESIQSMPGNSEEFDALPFFLR
jgi:hypothetical protein